MHQEFVNKAIWENFTSNNLKNPFYDSITEQEDEFLARYLLSITLYSLIVTFNTLLFTFFSLLVTFYSLFLIFAC